MGSYGEVPGVLVGAQVYSIIYTDNNPLSHLATAKLGATEQRWAAQLSLFDYVLRYRSGRSNTNADALSRQHLEGSSTGLAPAERGTLLPRSLQDAPASHPAVMASHTATLVFPSHTVPELCTLQVADPDIYAISSLWKQKRRPSAIERRQLSPTSLALLRQWDRLTEALSEDLVFRWRGGSSPAYLACPFADGGADFAPSRSWASRCGSDTRTYPSAVLLAGYGRRCTEVVPRV